MVESWETNLEVIIVIWARDQAIISDQEQSSQQFVASWTLSQFRHLTATFQSKYSEEKGDISEGYNLSTYHQFQK